LSLAATPDSAPQTIATLAAAPNSTPVAVVVVTPAATPAAAVTPANADRTDGLHDNALLAWLSSPRRKEVPLAEEVSSSRHSNEDFTQVDGSELDSVDQVFAGIANALVMDL
jgi:hypothetical protein